MDDLDIFYEKKKYFYLSFTNKNWLETRKLILDKT